MTPAEWAALGAREKDAAVAKAQGWTFIPRKDRSAAWGWRNPAKWSDNLPRYDCWATCGPLLTELHDRGWSGCLTFGAKFGISLFRAAPSPTSRDYIDASGTSGPYAIALAFCMAMEAEP